MKNIVKLCVIVCLSGCGLFQSHTQEIKQDVADEVNCILEGDISGMTAEQIAIKCGIQAVDDVVKIIEEANKFSAYKARKAQEHKP